MKALNHYLVHAWLHQNWTANIKTLAFILIGFVVVPFVFSYVLYFVGKLVTNRMGKTLGNHVQAVVGGLGNVLHESEMGLLAKLGGHSLQGFRMESLHNLAHMDATPTLDHRWISKSFYQSGFDFLLGTMPAYITAAVLWGLQTLLGGDTFHIAAGTSAKGLFGYTKHMFFSSLGSAFDAGGFLASLIFFILVIMIVSTAFNITFDEIHRAMSGIVIWALFLAVIWAVFLVIGKVPLLTTGALAFAAFSAYALAHAVVYLVVILIVVLILTAYSFVTRLI